MNGPKYGVCRHDFYAWGCTKKCLLYTALLTPLERVEGLSSIVCNIASLTSRILRYHTVLQYHASKHNSHAQLSHKNTHFFTIQQIPICESFHVHPLSSCCISMRSPIHLMSVSKLRIRLTTHVARNPCGE